VSSFPRADDHTVANVRVAGSYKTDQFQVTHPASTSGVLGLRAAV